MKGSHSTVRIQGEAWIPVAAKGGCPCLTNLQYPTDRKRKARLAHDPAPLARLPLAVSSINKQYNVFHHYNKRRQIMRYFHDWRRGQTVTSGNHQNTTFSVVSCCNREIWFAIHREARLRRVGRVHISDRKRLSWRPFVASCPLSWRAARFRAKMEQLKRCQGLLPVSQGLDCLTCSVFAGQRLGCRVLLRSAGRADLCIIFHNYNKRRQRMWCLDDWRR